MASAAMTSSLHTPFLEGSVPSDSPQQKRGLLWPVNVAVDKIVSNFSVARNIVQKAQLGDSRVNPSVGRLVLGDLCPALYTVLHDGLNLYQQDVILGRRPNSPWSVVEASVKAGPSLKPLYSLYYQLDQFSQLNNSQKKFNAFIFGLLNLKRLDFWISCLHSCREVLRTHYSPMAFLSLSHSSCRALFEELLLLLQPLSVFTFHLDPLFEYHHQSLADRGVLGSDPQLRGLDQKERRATHPRGTQQRQGGLPIAASGQPAEGKEGPGTGLGQKSQPRGSSERGEQVSGQREAAAEEVRDRETAQGTRAGRSPKARERQGGRAEPGYTLQQTFDQVMQWGDRLAQTLGDLHKPPAVVRQEPPTVPACSPLEPITPETAAGVKRKLSWWNQLSQSSQVYLATSQDSSVSAKWIKPKTTGSKTSSLPERNGQEPSAPGQESTGSTTAQQRSRQANNSVRVESAPQDTDRTGSPGPVAQKDSRDATNRKRSPDEQQDPTPCSRDPSDKLGEAALPATSPHSRPVASRSDLDGQAVLRLGDRLCLGRLFGARVPCVYSPSDQPQPEAQEGRRGRLPSDWLQVNMIHFEQLLKVIPVGKERSPQLTEISPPSQETSKPTRKVRTLCDHTATDEDHLSFRRGDTLEILACVDEDWIRCCHGDVTGLVPIGYTSLI
ncbi:AP-4 complex accessory subunit RUSC1-like isoform X2 [Cetorhinus maximus]